MTSWPIHDRRALFRLAGAIGLSGMVPFVARAEAAFAGAEEIRALIEDRVRARMLPGAIVSFARGSARPAYVAGGALDLDGRGIVDRDTIWRLASLTKPIVGMAAMLLISEGRLKIDQPVCDFIPGFSAMRTAIDITTGVSRPARGLITIRHLVTHTSGIVNDPAGYLADAYRGLGIGGHPWGTLPPAGAPQSLEDYAERLSQVPLSSDPGTRWQYSPNLDIVARVIEIVSGLPFDVFLQRRMFGPLGMSSTGFFVRRQDWHRLVTSYSLRDGVLVADGAAARARWLARPRLPSASGGLLSTARDYDRFLAMIVGGGLLDGERVFPADAVDMGTSNLLPPGTDMSRYTSKTGHDGFGAGGMVTVGGPRPGTFGWGGASGTTGFANRQLQSRWASYTNIGASDFARRAMAAAGMGFSETAMPGGAERPAS
jgi:CubicO group peptidase (beta-lactamase class C family)